MSNEEQDIPELEEPSYYERNNQVTRKFNQLRLELGMREDNEHNTSGMGGNPSEFWFLLNHTFKVYLSENRVSFTYDNKETVIAHIPWQKDFPLKEIRLAFTEFYNNHTDNFPMTKESIIDVPYLKTLEPKHMNARTYIRAVEVAKELTEWLDKKISFTKQLDSFFGEESKFVREQFLKEMNLPLTYFDKEKVDYDKIDYSDLNRNEDPMVSLLNKHPLWGVRLSAIKERQSKMMDNLFSQEDRDRMTWLDGCPTFIALQAIRSLVQIDRIIQLNLDETWDVLGRVNTETKD